VLGKKKIPSCSSKVNLTDKNPQLIDKGERAELPMNDAIGPITETGEDRRAERAQAKPASQDEDRGRSAIHD